MTAMVVWMWRQMGMHGVCAAGALLSLGCMWLLRRQAQVQVLRRCHSDAICDQFYAYALLDARAAPGEDEVAVAKRMCRTITESSPFGRLALLERDGEGRLTVTGSLGADDLTVRALERWSEGLPEGTRVDGRLSKALESALGKRVGRSSYVVRLERRQGRRGSVPDATELGCQDMIVIPLWTGVGKMVGVLALCSDEISAQQQRRWEEMLLPLEALAMKLGRSIENRQLTDRLLRAEKLVGLGQLAGGVAHALNNPLTAVLGFAELMADTAAEPRVRVQAGMIVTEAKRMRETVQSLLSFWRPQVQAEEPIEVVKLLEELEDACASKLESRGVRLVIQAGEAMPPVRGSRERLREALEHLLNNAAQAISAVQEATEAADAKAEEHVIRLTANYNAGALHLIVSDTGPGFKEPRRVFDPFYTTQQPGEGAGLGLSICFGIVREHGGEISAFNLHPHGAAVVLELPVGETVVAADRVVVGEVA